MKSFSLVASIISILSISMFSCSDGKSYAELLAEENISTNNFLADQRVEGYEQRDSTFDFKVGPDAPYYQLDEEGNIFMQVLNPGTKGNRAADDQMIYFRFIRYNLHKYVNGTLPEGSGNNINVAGSQTFFRYNNPSNANSAQWGTGLQAPMQYLPIDCEVNIVIKSQFGLTSEMTYVIPYLFNVRYFKSQI